MMKTLRVVALAGLAACTIATAADAHA